MLVLTTYDGDADSMRAVDSGAIGYLLKDTPGEQIIAAVFAASRGETGLAPPVAPMTGRGPWCWPWSADCCNHLCPSTH
ncbi:hypothetical protein [Pseudarthrobacter sp. N5]|uniref:hypothetical protein n=1 Tax=Pseudarthrobacter sp. N5 TaxID=3418416 RepID=UPI003CF27EDE